MVDVPEASPASATGEESRECKDLVDQVIMDIGSRTTTTRDHGSASGKRDRIFKFGGHVASFRNVRLSDG